MSRRRPHQQEAPAREPGPDTIRVSGSRAGADIIRHLGERAVHAATNQMALFLEKDYECQPH